MTAAVRGGAPSRNLRVVFQTASFITMSANTTVRKQFCCMYGARRRSRTDDERETPDVMQDRLMKAMEDPN